MNNLTGALKSKTVWLGVVVAALSALQAAISDSGISAGELSVVGPLLGVLIVYLRTLTNKPLSDK